MTDVTIPMCFWCREDQFDPTPFRGREIVRVVMGYGFCDKCRRKCEGKIVCIEVDTPEHTGNPSFTDNPPFDHVSPTGSWALVDAGAFDSLPFPPGVMAIALKARRALIDRAVFDNVFSKGGKNESDPDQLRV